MNIDNLVKDFKTYEELKAFCDSQFKQILILTKKVKDLEEKNKELSKSSQKDISLSTIQPPQTGLATVGFIVDDAKIIAQVQLNFMKQNAFDRELTLEETKRLEIYNKILNVKEEPQKTVKATAKTLSDEELLASITDGSK